MIHKVFPSTIGIYKMTETAVAVLVVIFVHCVMIRQSIINKSRYVPSVYISIEVFLPKGIFEQWFWISKAVVRQYAQTIYSQSISSV